MAPDDLSRPGPPEPREAGPEAPEPSDRDTDETRAAAREAAAAAKVLGRQLGVLAAGAARGAGRRAAGAARAAGPALDGLGRASPRGRRRRSGGSAPASPAEPAPARVHRSPASQALARRRARAGAAAARLLAGSSSTASRPCRRSAGLCPKPGQRALTVEADDGRVFATRGAFQGQKLTAADLPPHLAQAIVAIEDRRFHATAGSTRAGWRGRCAATPSAAACARAPAPSRSNTSG